MDNDKDWNYLHSLRDVKSQGWKLCLQNEMVRKNRKIVIAALKNHGNALRDAAEEFQDDQSMVFIAMRQCYKAIQFASERLCDNFDFMMSCVTKYPKSFQYASPRLLDNEILASKAVKGSGKMYKYCSLRVMSIQNIAKDAVMNNWWNYKKHVPIVLKSNPDLALSSIQNNYKNLTSVPQKLIRDPFFIVRTANIYPEIMCNNWIRMLHSDNKMVMEIFIQEKPSNVHFLSGGLQNDRDFIWPIIKKHPTVYEHCSKVIKQDLEISKYVISKSPQMYKYVPYPLKEDFELALDANVRCYENLRHTPCSLTTNPEFVTIVLMESYDYREYIWRNCLSYYFKNRYGTCDNFLHSFNSQNIKG